MPANTETRNARNCAMCNKTLFFKVSPQQLCFAISEYLGELGFFIYHTTSAATTACYRESCILDMSLLKTAQFTPQCNSVDPKERKIEKKKKRKKDAEMYLVASIILSIYISTKNPNFPFPLSTNSRLLNRKVIHLSVLR